MLDKTFITGANGNGTSASGTTNENEGSTDHATKRSPLDQATFHEVYQLNRPERKGAVKQVLHACKTRCASCNVSSNFFWQQCKKRLPILKWLPKYDFRNCLISDMAGGLTVGIMHIPQGMAYSLLANVPPVVGLYVSFFPVLIYCIMGSSMHLSVGSSTVVSLMVGKIIQSKVDSYHLPQTTITHNFTSASMEDMDDMEELEDDEMEDFPLEDFDMDAYKIKIAATTCLLVGLIQMAMAFLQLGALSVYLSDMLISGFTTGAAVHSLTSQIKYLVGVSIPSREGPLNMLYTYVDVTANIMDANVPTCIISAISIVAILAVNEGINARYRHKMKIPVPIELIVIVAATLVSYYLDLNDEYDVKIVNRIPTGIPPPSLPDPRILDGKLADVMAIAVVVFSLSISVSKLLAKRHKYEVNATQELLAHGTSNVFSAFFSCFPSCASISRSLVQEVAGGKTQLASAASCVLLLIVLLVIAPLFASLPNCVLAAIIVVALKGMFRQFGDFKRAWKVSKLDAATWAVTFLAVVIFEVEIGLGVGIAFSLLTILVRTKRPKTYLMGNVPNTDIYLGAKKFKTAVEIEGINIVHFGGALYFANKDFFKSEVYKKTFSPQALAAHQKKTQNRLEKDKRRQQEQQCDVATISMNNNNNNNSLYTSETPEHHQVELAHAHTIIIDCSAISFIDAAGLTSLSQLLDAFQEVKVRLFLADLQDNVFEKVEQSEFYSVAKGNIFPSVHDAVMYAQMASATATTSAPPAETTSGTPVMAAQSSTTNNGAVPNNNGAVADKETAVSDQTQPGNHAYVNIAFEEYL